MWAGKFVPRSVYILKETLTVVVVVSRVANHRSLQESASKDSVNAICRKTGTEIDAFYELLGIVRTHVRVHAVLAYDQRAKQTGRKIKDRPRSLARIARHLRKATRSEFGRLFGRVGRARPFNLEPEPNADLK